MNGVPAQRFVKDTEFKFEIAVVLTSLDLTLAALKEASNLAGSLGGRITLIVPCGVPWGSLHVLLELNEHQLEEVNRLETSVSLCLCRYPRETLKSVLTPYSLLVVASRKRWWPTAETRLAGRMRRAGHQVVLTQSE